MDQSEVRVEHHPALESYLKVAFSFMQGLVRLTGARAAHFRLLCALSSFRDSGCVGLDGLGKDALRHLAKIEYGSLRLPHVCDRPLTPDLCHVAVRYFSVRDHAFCCFSL